MPNSKGASALNRIEHLMWSRGWPTLQDLWLQLQRTASAVLQKQRVWSFAFTVRTGEDANCGFHFSLRDTSGAARTNLLAAASSSNHRPMALYETGDQEFAAPSQFAEATGRSSLPREFRAPRTSVQRSDKNAPLPSSSITACCSRAPRPIVPGIQEKKRMARLAGCPGSEVSNVLIMRIRSTPAVNIDSSIATMFADSSAEISLVAAVTPSAVRTASAPEKASTRAGRSAKDSTTATRDPLGMSVIRSGRERTMAVKLIPASRHALSIP